jgi:hypothetical protein
MILRWSIYCRDCEREREIHPMLQQRPIDGECLSTQTNITRDFLEDINEGRIFWPEEVWYVVRQWLVPRNHQHPDRW